MNWDNETVLKFLELYQIQQCIWDPQNKSHKNRQHVNDAWNNIKENLGLGDACTVKDLKKKKESLMSAYRNYKTKIKKSERSGSGMSDVYQPSWFAFSFMDSFLGSVYTCSATQSTEDEDNASKPPTSNKDSQSIKIPSLEDNESSPTTSSQESSSATPTPTVRRRQRNPTELREAKQHMEQAFNFMKQISEKDDDSECTLFGQLIARKMRKLSDDRRDIMMVKINQLFVDEHILNSHRRYSAATYESTPSPQQYNVYSPQSPKNINIISGGSDDPLNSLESEITTAVNESSQPSISFSSREFIIPNTMYHSSTESFKDFIVLNKKK